MENTELIIEQMRKTLENAAYTSSNTKQDLAKVMITVANKLLLLEKEMAYIALIRLMEGA